MTLSAVLQIRALASGRATAAALPAMDEEEFRQLYERTARPLWAYLSRLTRDVHLADDLLQETYYRFCRAGARHENEAHRRNSLFQIATNLARDAVRRAGRHDDVRLGADAGDEADAAAVELASPAHGERQVQVRTDLRRALARLPAAQRELLLLAYGQGASHDEIADITGLRASSVRTLLLRARRKLAVLLDRGVAAAKAPAVGAGESGE